MLGRSLLLLIKVLSIMCKVSCSLLHRVFCVILDVSCSLLLKDVQFCCISYVRCCCC
jgi:hypothetical protein